MIPLKDTVKARTFSLVNWLLIAANIVVFLLQIRLGADIERFIATFGFIPARFLGALSLGQVLTIFISMFLHGSWLHLISNMLALYIFGDNVEDRIGHGRYLIFYLICGLTAALTHTAFNATSLLPTIGASGAIGGVLGAYFLLFPRARVTTLVFIFILPWFVQIPAVVYLGFWFLSQLWSGASSLGAAGQANGGVAFWAHVGGFLTGLLLVKPFEQRRSVRRPQPDEDPHRY
jgi:membrane associated rhomboid family serine protease